MCALVASWGFKPADKANLWLTFEDSWLGNEPLISQQVYRETELTVDAMDLQRIRQEGLSKKKRARTWHLIEHLWSSAKSLFIKRLLVKPLDLQLVNKPKAESKS